jgi:hypothetical protein
MVAEWDSIAATSVAGHDTRALQAYLGHRNIQHTLRYSELAPRGSRISGGRSLTSEGSDAETCRGFSSGSSNCRTFWDADPGAGTTNRKPDHTRFFGPA